MCRKQKDAVTGAYVLEQLARIYMLVGDDDKAVATLVSALRVPSLLSVGWLRVDPSFAPLKRSAAFRRLISQS